MAEKSAYKAEHLLALECKFNSYMAMANKFKIGSRHIMLMTMASLIDGTDVTKEEWRELAEKALFVSDRFNPEQQGNANDNAG